MRKLTAILLAGLVLLWATVASAQSYSALDDSSGDVSIGLGGIVLSGDDGSGESGSEFLPTISLTGINEYVVWQAFYGFGSDSSVFGGSVDWILASNFDECAVCPTEGLYWFGVGPTLVSYSDLFADEAVTTSAVSETEIGLNIGGGWRQDQWGLDVYVHYLPSNSIIGVQGMLLYNFSN
jgi:hypothetical protein